MCDVIAALYFQGFFVALIFCLCNGEVHSLLRKTASRYWPAIGGMNDFSTHTSMNNTQVTEAYAMTDNTANKAANKVYIPMTNMIDEDACANEAANGGVIC